MALSNLNALSAAMHTEQDVTVRALKLQLEEKQLALERARMSTEDARAAMVSPYLTGSDHPRSWREFGAERNKRCNHLDYNVIEPAQRLLLDARREMRVAFDDPNCNYKVAMTAAYNAMRDVEERLEDNAVSIESASESAGDDATSGGATSDDDDDHDDHEIRCIVCEAVSSPDFWFNIVPVGNVAPATRIVCGSCYAANPAMDEVDSFF